MKMIVNCLIAIVLLITQYSCDTTEPPLELKLKLELEDVSCTEAWLKISTNNLQLPSEINLVRTDSDGNSLSKVSILSTQDSLLYQDSLLPNKTYSYQAITTGMIPTASSKIQVTTMDTTSHNFTWQTFTFGGNAGSSVLYDVAIISEDNIWCVGEINIADTSTNGYTTYNAVHWDGTEWELKRVLYNGNFWTIKTIFAFNENDIWFSAFVRYNGENFIELPIPDVLMGWSVNKIWGTSSSDLYVVGNNGNIAQYQNGNWKKIESKTNLNFYDIWGGINIQTIQEEILTVGSDVGTASGSVILKIANQNVIPFSTKVITGNITSIWFEPNRAYFIGSSGVLYYKHRLTDSIWNDYGNVTPYSVTSIAGNNVNDVFIATSLGDIVHFNGLSWNSYYNQTQLSGGVYGVIKSKDNITVSAGFIGNRAVITVGKR